LVITYKQLPKITFPVFILPSEDWSFSDGLMFMDGKVVDDRNMEGKTLGIRRLQTPYPTLFPLRRSIDYLNGILKQQKKTFIDSKGIPFIYEKTIRCQLKYYRIKKKELRDTECLLWLKGVSTPFSCPRPPDESYGYAGILLLSRFPWILYEYSDQPKKDTWRLV